MNITAAPNLKPFRDYDEHEVLNMFAAEEGTLNKGTFVTISEADGNTNVMQNEASPVTPYLESAGSLSGVPSRALALRTVVAWKVRTATYEDDGQILGVTLADVAETNTWGEKLIYRPRIERIEQLQVPSGQAVPILTRGVVKINGIEGTPGPGSGGVLASGSDGVLTVDNGTTARCGKFLTSKDADGYAIFKVEL